MREVEVLRDGKWQWVQWRFVAVGDVVKVKILFALLIHLIIHV